MIIRYLRPHTKIDFDKFNEIIHHKKGKYTFPLQLAILLNHYGLNVKCFSSDDVKTTQEDSEQFKRWFGKDYDYEMQFVSPESYNWVVITGKKKGLFAKRKTSFGEILNYFKKGNIVSFPVDWNTLVGKKGPYEGHFVVLTEIDGENVCLHDPDIGPFVKYKKETVEKAYHHPAIADDLLVVYGLR